MRLRVVLGLLIIVAIAVGVRWYQLRGGSREAVFLIVVDTLRRDRLSCYGYGAHETPNLDGLAERGVRFDRAISTGGWTVPSMGAVMTSRYPSQLGLIEKPSKRRHSVQARRAQTEKTIAPGFSTLAEVLRDAGYRTVGFVNQPVLAYKSGFAQGFSEWFHPYSADSVLYINLQESEIEKDSRQDVKLWADIALADSVLVAAFVDWIPSVQDEKLFVWVHLLTPHLPYDPPPRFGVKKNERLEPKYNAEVRYADELVGRILDAIDDEIGIDRSVIFFTSDHGEELGEREENFGRGHGHSLHAECVNIPMILSGPELVRGTRVRSRARLLDVMPTILGLCDVDASVVDGMEGVDLTPLALGTELDLPVYVEGLLYGPSERALVEGDYKLMWDELGDKYRLFDTASDRGELNDVASEFESVTADMSGSMIGLKSRLTQDYMAFKSGELADDSLSTEDERRRALEAMRALGYVNE